MLKKRPQPQGSNWGRLWELCQGGLARIPERRRPARVPVQQVLISRNRAQAARVIGGASKTGCCHVDAGDVGNCNRADTNPCDDWTLPVREIEAGRRPENPAPGRRVGCVARVTDAQIGYWPISTPVVLFEIRSGLFCLNYGLLQCVSPV